MNRALLLQRVWSHSPKELATSQPQHTRRPASITQSTSRFLPPQLLILLAMVSLQLGAAFAKSLFPVVGSTGTVFLRLAFAAIVLMLMWRPRLRGYTRKDYITVVLFGVTMAGLNGFFYAALARLPLGIVVTLEFVGPLSIALFSSRRRIDVFWALFAVAGIILLAPINGATVDPLGVGLALIAGAFWAAYILLNVRVGQAFPGGTGLALGMSIGASGNSPLWSDESPSDMARSFRPTHRLRSGRALFSDSILFGNGSLAADVCSRLWCVDEHGPCNGSPRWLRSAWRNSWPTRPYCDGTHCHRIKWRLLRQQIQQPSRST